MCKETPGHRAHRSLLASFTNAAKEAVKRFQRQEGPLSGAAECEPSRKIRQEAAQTSANILQLIIQLSLAFIDLYLPV